MQPFSSRLYNIVARCQDETEVKYKAIAISRVFSGVLKTGQKVFVMGPKHQVNGQVDVKEVEIRHLFLLMGSSLKLID